MGQADYLPVLTAAEIDILLGPSWPLRPGRALQLVLQELVATGRLRTETGKRRWPVEVVPGADPPARGMAADVHRLFVTDGGLTAERFTERMASAFEDHLVVVKGAPGGQAWVWYQAWLERGLIAEGLVELGEQPGYLIGDKAYGTRTGLNLTGPGRQLVGYLRPLLPPARPFWRERLERRKAPPRLPGPLELTGLVELTRQVDDDLFRQDDGGELPSTAPNHN